MVALNGLLDPLVYQIIIVVWDHLKIKMFHSRPDITEELKAKPELKKFQLRRQVKP